MSHVITVPVGVIIARERIDHPWQDYRWRPVSVFLDAQEITTWREVARTPSAVHYHAATLPLELHRKETAAYQVNLANGLPSVYVVLRDEPGGGEQGVSVHLVSASPFEVQAYGSSGLEIVERVPMPDPLLDILVAFIERHHVEEPFIKRQRERYNVNDDHKFGQQPIFEMRHRAGSKNQRRDG